MTGATGNVGYSVVRALLAAPGIDEVVGLARRAPHPVAPYDDPRFRWQRADVGHDDLDAACAGADAVVHLAWMFHPTRDAVQTWRGNVVGTQRLMAAAHAAGASAFVVASSIGAYSPAPADGHPVGEDHPTDALPTAAYGRQKSYVERLCDVYEASHPDLRVVRIRSAFVFQHAAAPAQRRIFAGPLLPGRLVGRRRAPVLPYPAGLRMQTVHADDLATAYVAAVLRPARGAFNIAAEPVLDRRALERVMQARMVEIPSGVVRRLLAVAFALRLVPAEPGLFDLFASLPVMDCGRARDELGWCPRRDAAEALGAFLEGLADPAGGPTPPLDAHAGGRLRWRELATGVGARDGAGRDAGR